MEHDFREGKKGMWSRFKKRPRDFYPTIDPDAAQALYLQLGDIPSYVEPCAGDGSLISLLHDVGGECVAAGDIAPQTANILGTDILECDVFSWTKERIGDNVVITNPPYTRSIMHSIFDHFLHLDIPAYYLIEASWLFTQQAQPFLRWATIYTVGRLVLFTEDEDGNPKPPVKGTKDFVWLKLSSDGQGKLLPYILPPKRKKKQQTPAIAS